MAQDNRHLFHLFWLSFVGVLREIKDKFLFIFFHSRAIQQNKNYCYINSNSNGWKGLIFPGLRTKSTLKVIWNEDEMVNSLICFTSLRYWFSLTLISISLSPRHPTPAVVIENFFHSHFFLFDEIAIFCLSPSLFFHSFAASCWSVHYRGLFIYDAFQMRTFEVKREKER
jgi:hypothetical protein